MAARLAILFFIGQLAIMSPGPDFFLVVKNSLRCTRRAALATAWGITTGFCIHVSYCALGLSAALVQKPELMSGLRVFGACYLIWIGAGALRATNRAARSIALRADRRFDEVRAAYFEGLFCNLCNPKVALFLVGVFTQLVGPESEPLELARFAAVLIAQSAVYWPLLTIFIQRQRSGGWLDRHSHRFDRMLGLVLIALGVELAFS